MTLLSKTPDWFADAACKGQDLNLFFPSVRSNSISPIAKQTCAGCPVREDCENYGIKEEEGVWGGMTPLERRRLRKRRQVENYKKNKALQAGRTK